MRTLLASLAILAAVALHGHPLGAGLAPKQIRVSEYRDKVYASWLGQIIGNTYGLSYEFRYIHQPGPKAFPYGYGPMLARVQEVNGAFSDDDTDIEYMYLLQMEKHGIEPSYQNLAEAWMHHVKERVWVANRMALTLMHAGFQPPLTGDIAHNSQWFAIDPQLVNEIWAVTAPGMTSYAVAKTRWAARITSDGFGCEPAMAYGAMYSAAFFEKDVRKLVDIAQASLPPQARFARTIQHMKELFRAYPEDWHQARQRLSETYYREFDYNKDAWRVVDANLNGACGILALLYGQGDFQKTLDLACGMGFDADNQAATLCGLIGLMGGTAVLPKDLVNPLPSLRWTKPFNDRYVNVSRFDLPDAGLQDLADRIARQGEKIILAHGGKKMTQGGVDWYQINPRARFRAPLELPSAPPLMAEEQVPFSFVLPLVNETSEKLTCALTDGKLPKGVRLQGLSLSGTPSEAGSHQFTLALSRGSQRVTRNYEIQVHTPNLAPRAVQLLHNIPEEKRGSSLEVIRDGARRDRTYYSKEQAAASKQDHYGYLWDQPQTISLLVFNPGVPEEFAGWFTSLGVEYLTSQGDWVPVEDLKVSPKLSLENVQWLKGAYIDHTLAFRPIQTRGIRIIGQAGGVERDAANGGGISFFTSISELSVHQR